MSKMAYAHIFSIFIRKIKYHAYRYKFGIFEKFRNWF